MSVFVNNKSLLVQVRNTDYSRENTLQNILAKLTTSSENPLLVDLANSTIPGIVDDINVQVNAINTSVQMLMTSDNRLKIAQNPVVATLLDGGAINEGDVTSSLQPAGSTCTLWGTCVGIDSDDPLVLVIQYSHDGSTFYNSSNFVELAGGEPYELTFWTAAPYVRVAGGKNSGNAKIYFASR